jgi:hypothetical protein
MAQAMGIDIIKYPSPGRGDRRNAIKIAAAPTGLPGF